MTLGGLNENSERASRLGTLAGLSPRKSTRSTSSGTSSAKTGPERRTGRLLLLCPDTGSVLDSQCSAVSGIEVCRNGSGQGLQVRERLPKRRSTTRRPETCHVAAQPQLVAQPQPQITEPASRAPIRRSTLAAQRAHLSLCPDHLPGPLNSMSIADLSEQAVVESSTICAHAKLGSISSSASPRRLARTVHQGNAKYSGCVICLPPRTVHLTLQSILHVRQADTQAGDSRPAQYLSMPASNRCHPAFDAHWECSRLPVGHPFCTLHTKMSPICVVLRKTSCCPADDDNCCPSSTS